MSSTSPLQLIREPIVVASLQLNPAAYLAANAHAPNFPIKAVKIMAKVYAQVMPNENHEKTPSDRM